MPNTTLEQVTNLAAQLSQSERLALIEHLARELRAGAAEREPRSLRGRWKGKFPIDVDVDSALEQARGEWVKESAGLEAERE